MWSTLGITFQLAFVTTFILVIIGIPLGYWLSKTNVFFKPVLEALVTLPLLLPPTVLGFYMLILFGKNSTVGIWLENVLGIKLVFTFSGLVLASIIYSLPFMVQSIQAGFQKVPSILKEASYCLGKSKTETFFKVQLPNIKNALITGIVLTFAHTIGEFGVVLMIGGNLPGKTKVASIAIYEAVEGMNYEEAHILSAILLIISFSILCLVYTFNRKNIQILG